MSLNNIQSFVFLSAIFVFSSCKKSDSSPGTLPDPVPTITSISPTSGPSSTLDTLVGTNFSTKDSVFFNGKNASIVSSTATQLVVKVPPQAGTGNVSITAGGISVTGPVFTFVGDTYLVSTFAGGGSAGYNDGTGTGALFHTPYSIAIDHDDNLYVSDYGNNMIRKITPAGVVTTLAGSTTSGATDGTGAAASFNLPLGLAVDGDDNVYVADDGNNMIRKITPGGVVSTLAGSGIKGFADGTGSAAIFFNPQAVAVDGSNNVFVVDYGNKKIRKVTASGVVSSFAGSGALGSADGTGAAASFSGITGIGIDAVGNLYVTDGDNENIRKITIDGVVTTIAGKTESAGYDNGPGSSATFSTPTAIAVDSHGFMYVADEANRTIRQITPTGTVSLLAGTVNAPGTDDGPALKAKFAGPTGVAIDSHGNIFVADAYANAIRKLTPQ